MSRSLIFSFAATVLAVSAAVAAAAPAPGLQTSQIRPVSNPAPAEETAKIIEAMEKAVNLRPDRKIATQRQQYEMNMPMQAIKGTIVSSFKAPDKFRVEMKVPGMPDNIEIFDGSRGYSVTGGFGVREKYGEELDMMRFQASIANPGAKPTDTFASFDLDPERYAVNERECYRLVAHPKAEYNLSPMEFLVDCENHHILRTTALVPLAVGKVLSVTDFSDYREFDGLVLPVSQKTKVLGMPMEMKLINQELDIALDDALFIPEKQ